MKFRKIIVASLATASLMTSVNLSPSVTAETISDVTMTFENPDQHYRPLTRWWVPGTQMTKDEIRSEIQSMVKAGFGGAEVVPVSTEGGDGEGTLDWGSDAWKDLTGYMLEVASEYDFTIDFTMTPAWPLALPTVTDINDPNQGAQMELDGAYKTGITKKKPFKGELPTSKEITEDLKGTGIKPTLVAVTVAKYKDKSENILDFDSAQSLELSQVKQDGDKNTITFKPKDDGEYVLFAWYQYPSANKKYGNNQIDHFSITGTNQIINYWEEELLPAYGDHVKSIRSLFIDSLEFETHLDWTYGVLEGFQKENQYDLAAYLPTLYDSDAIGNYMGNPSPDFSFNKNNKALKNDFRNYMTKLYIENHIKPLTEFAQSHGLTLRYQTSYGKNLELAQTALYPSIPETETLYGSDYLDFYRLQSGAVHATNKAIYSIESAAEWTEQWNEKDPETGEYKTRGNGKNNSGNYEQTFQDHIWHDQRAFAVGVNQVVFHGYAYNGHYDGENSSDGFIEGVKWPGFDGFGSSSWSNSWGERQPNWQMAATYTDFIARNQYILQQGRSKVDIAIYDHSYYENIDFIGSKKVYDSIGLEQNGFTYDFVSPATLELDNMTVTNQLLDENGTGYKALILNNQKYITEAAAKRILSYAKAGLPIIIVGNSPSKAAFYKDSNVKTVIDELLTIENVIQVASTDKVVETLSANNVVADSSYNAKLLSNHRSTDDMDYYYFYNYGDASNYPEVQKAKRVQTDVVIQGQGQPYLLNTWTGEVTAIANYSSDGKTMTIPVDIAGNDSIIIAVSKSDETTLPEVVSKDLEVSYQSDNQLLIKGRKAGKVSIDGKERTIDLAKADAPITLKNWTLSVEAWSKGDTPSSTEKTHIELGKLKKLKTWDKIKKLKNVSGVGVYSTTFKLEKGWQDNQGAILSHKLIKDAYEIKINDQVVKTSQVDKKVDIGPYLVSGDNKIEITIATSLLNAVLEENEDDLREADQHGLTGELKITPYTYQVVSVD